jgi:uncharacterized iron-regulated protein
VTPWRTAAAAGLVAAVLQAGCAVPAPATGAGAAAGVADPAAPAVSAATGAATLTLDRPIVLLGEVHDNAAQHALRLRAFEAVLARGARPALVMEQFDRQRQPAIDARRRAAPPPDADAIIAAGAGGGGVGWQWGFYRPFVALALAHDLPIVAANVGRDEARAVMRDGLAAHGFDADVPDALLQAQARAIEASHCGSVGGDLARRMALAQVARDQAMARALQAHASRGAVLLAGNGHVRTDIGAPRWLDAATRARSEAVGVVEARDPTAAFDRRVVTPAQPRPDPCAGAGGSRG